jgi:hypothetical protein
MIKCMTVVVCALPIDTPAQLDATNGFEESLKRLQQGYSKQVVNGVWFDSAGKEVAELCLMFRIATEDPEGIIALVKEYGRDAGESCVYYERHVACGYLEDIPLPDYDGLHPVNSVDFEKEVKGG